MADTDKPTDSNKTMQREQGHSGQREQGGFDKDRQREQGHSGQREEGKGGCCGSDSDSDREQGQSGQREEGKGGCCGSDSDREQGQRGQRDQGGSDKERQEKSAIGGGEMSGPSGQMSGQNKEFDKNRSEPTSR